MYTPKEAHEHELMHGQGSVDWLNDVLPMKPEEAFSLSVRECRFLLKACKSTLSDLQEGKANRSDGLTLMITRLEKVIRIIES